MALPHLDCTVLSNWKGVVDMLGSRRDVLLYWHLALSMPFVQRRMEVVHVGTARSLIVERSMRLRGFAFYDAD